MTARTIRMSGKSPDIIRLLSHTIDAQVAELWDARYGIALSGSEITGWTGRQQGIVLAPPAAINRPTYEADGANFFGRPVVKFTAANSQCLIARHSTNLCAPAGVGALAACWRTHITGTGAYQNISALRPQSAAVDTMLHYHHFSGDYTVWSMMNKVVNVGAPQSDSAYPRVMVGGADLTASVTRHVCYNSATRNGTFALSTYTSSTLVQTSLTTGSDGIVVGAQYDFTSNAISKASNVFLAFIVYFTAQLSIAQQNAIAHCLTMEWGAA